MTKLQYLIRTSYYVRPEANSDTYQTDISKLVSGIITEYLECLRNNELPKETIILNLKEIIYNDLTFAFNKKTKQEKENLIQAYLFIVNEASEIIKYSISSSATNPQTILNQINNYILYTQFWETDNWGNYSVNIKNIIITHRRNLISISYKIIHQIITLRLDSSQYFRISKQIIDLFGLQDMNEFTGNFYDNLIQPSGFHAVKFDDSYFTTIFLYAVYLSDGEEVFDRYFKKFIKESKEGTQSSICMTLLDKMDDIKDEEIQILSLSTYEVISNTKEIFKQKIRGKVKFFVEIEKSKVFKMPISESKFKEYKKDLKKTLYYQDIESKSSDSIKMEKFLQYINIPKIVMIEQNGTILLGNYINYDILGQLMYKKIINIKKEQEKILNLKEIDPEYNKLLLPREYYVDIVDDFNYANFPESKNNFFNEIKINGATFYYHWLINSDSIYAISTKDSEFFIDYKKIEINIIDTIKNQKNEAMLKIKIEIPYYMSESLKIKKYSMQRIKKDV